MNKVYCKKLMSAHYFRLTILSFYLLSIRISIVHAQCGSGKEDCGSSEVKKTMYKIISKCSGKCLDVADNSKNDGAIIHQWSCHGGDNQLFIFKSTSEGYYRIKVGNSDKCIDVKGNSKKDGAMIHQWSCHRGNNQLFMIESVADGYYRIKAKNSNKYLEVTGNYKKDGAILRQRSWHGGDNQLWSVTTITR